MCLHRLQLIIQVCGEEVKVSAESQTRKEAPGKHLDDGDLLHVCLKDQITSCPFLALTAASKPSERRRAEDGASREERRHAGGLKEATVPVDPGGHLSQFNYPEPMWSCSLNLVE